VNQLLAAIKRLGAKGSDVPDYLKGITKIIPVIITRDNFGGFWGRRSQHCRSAEQALDSRSLPGA
jgi:hypothetical protein